MNKTDRERMEINKKALLAGLKSRKDFLERNLFETMELIEAKTTQKLVAQKKSFIAKHRGNKGKDKRSGKTRF